MYKYLIAGLAALSLTATATADPREWKLDLGHAHIGWEIDHFGFSDTVGQFNSYDGTFLIDEEAPENSRVSFRIDAASIDSNHTGRDNHLRAEDFLDVANHPTIDFVSTQVEMTDTSSGKIFGNVTLKGNTHPMTLDFVVTSDARFAEFLPRYNQLRAVGFEATGKIDRVAHGFDMLNFPGTPIGQFITFNIHFDLVDCDGAPNDNVPCQYGRNDTLEFPYEN